MTLKKKSVCNAFMKNVLSGRGTANPKPVRDSRPRSCKRKIESDTPGCAADTQCESKYYALISFFLET